MNAEFNNCFIIHSKDFYDLSLYPRRLSSKVWPIPRYGFKIQTFFFLQILLKKYITSIEQYVLRTLAFLSFRLFFPKSLVRNLAISSLDSRERNFLSSLVNKRLGGRTLKRGWSMVYSPSASFPGKCIHRSTSFPFQYTIDCSHLPNLVNSGWLWRISRGLWANHKQQ